MLGQSPECPNLAVKLPPPLLRQAAVSIVELQGPEEVQQVLLLLRGEMTESIDCRICFGSVALVGLNRNL